MKSLNRVGSVVVLVALVSVSVELCEVPCTKEFVPVCGTDGEHFKMFSNNCQMRNEHCKNGLTWFQTRMDMCYPKMVYKQFCEVPCTRELRPICGTDGKIFKVFPNRCIMGNQHCKDGLTWIQTRMDECSLKMEQKPPCEVLCTMEYRPVCGTDGKIFKVFPNRCIMGNEHCKDGRTWIQTQMDNCFSKMEQKRPCEVQCTLELRPVCGTDGKNFKSFSNSCVMRNQRCKDGLKWIQTRMDDCLSKMEQKRPCEVQCTLEFRPVCGTDGTNFKIFSNSCVMRNQHCKDGQFWFQTHMNNCGNSEEQ